jgi:hypothetical protein
METKINLTEQDQRTIFVMLPYLKNENVLASMFKTAHNPLRVFVGVGVPCALKPNVRSVSVKHNFGSSIARQEIFESLYRKENYIMCVRHATCFLPGWDKHLVQLIENRDVISQWATSKDNHNRTTFPIFDKFVNKIPKFKPLHVAQTSNTSFEIGLATWECVFARANTLSSMLSPGLPHVRDCEDDLLLSVFCFQKKLNVFTPGRALVLAEPSELKDDDLDFKRLRAFTIEVLQVLLFDQELKSDEQPLFLDLHEPANAEFWETLGVDLQSQEASGKSRLGLLKVSFQEQDILHRFGSMRTFHELKLLISK